LSHPNKVRGTRWEVAVRDYLREKHYNLGVENEEDIERTGAVHGQNDRGDIRGLRRWVIECKDEQKIDLPQYIREAKVEKDNASAWWYAVVVKARRKSVSDAYVVMDLAQFVSILALLREY
jgi:hypothetical protein